MNTKIMAIYSITNLVNNKKYIGSSKNINNRWKKHISDLNTGNHHNKHLQRAWNKYGESSFLFQIVEVVQDELSLFEREQYWIDLLEVTDSNKGYNLAKIATAPSPMQTYVTIKSVSQRKLIKENFFTKNDKVFLFTILPYLTSNNEVKIDYKYPTDEILKSILDMSKNVYFQTLKSLTDKGVIEHATFKKCRVITILDSIYSSNSMVN